ncbi:MAG: hypothetical protein QXJ75_04405 [Candidatus Bathyarchaeia archaeon]
MPSSGRSLTCSSMLLLLSIAEVTQGPWVDFKKEHLLVAPILDLNRLGKKVKDALLSLYDKKINGKKICESEFKALPKEFAYPETRKIIDEEINKILGIKSNLDTLYKLLANEPMICG